MDKNLLIFLVWIAFILLGQVRRKKGRKKEKISGSSDVQAPPQKEERPSVLICKETREEAEPLPPLIHPDLLQEIKPLHSDLQQDIREELQELRPTVVERKNKPVVCPAHRRRLQGNLREGMLWSLVLGRPRSLYSWGKEQQEKRKVGFKKRRAF